MDVVRATIGGALKVKCAIIVDENLPLGLVANTAAVLAMSIGDKVKSVVGDDVRDQDGTVHSGITRLTIPLLRGNPETIKAVRERLERVDDGSVFFVDFCDVAQRSKVYDEYVSRMAQTPAEELTYLGIAVCGPDRLVKSITGNLGLLR